MAASMFQPRFKSKYEWLKEKSPDQAILIQSLLEKNQYRQQRMFEKP